MQYIPIFVASTGRAGSTLTMKIMASHPQILVRSLFPYETRTSQYYYICHLQGIEWVNFTPLKLGGIEYRPFQGNDKESSLWSQKQEQKKLEEYGINLTEEYYHFVAEQEHKPQAKSFAEKLVGLPLVKQMIDSLKEYKIIFLQRDPRDTFFSIKSFNKKRGYVSFGEEQGDRTMFSNLIGFYKQYQQLQKSLNKESYINLKYEDLLTEKMATISKLFQSLNVDYSDRQVLDTIKYAFAESPESFQHQTSSSIQGSLSRWKQEADDRTLKMFASFHDELQQIGYK
ncbi:MAG: sulfotransferase [Xenococcaceae cyanobacterium MO_188.B29]|nr:sulfotransferase [Xenococcaceae cyanobacterium MO_188.B29]